MKTAFLLFLAVAWVLLAGCKPKLATSAATHDKFVTVDELKPYIINLNRRVSALEDNQTGWVAIDTDSQSYEKLWTPFGVLLVSTKSVTPYLDGYKVKVAIGNPYYVTFLGFKLSYWCVRKKITFPEAKAPFDPSKPYEKPPKTQENKTDELGGVLVPPSKTETVPDFASLRPVHIEDRTETLYPGSWNEIEFTVAPATADDIRNLRMSIDLSEVRLDANPNPQ